MTQKSRRRKLEKKQGIKKYYFETNKGLKLVEAHNLREAKEIFQERFGYWPNTK